MGFLGKTLALPPTILTLFLSPLGFSHCGFVLELGDLIFCLDRAQAPQLCELEGLLLLLKLTNVELDFHRVERLLKK